MDVKELSCILVPVDGSAASDAAVRFAAQLAGATGAQLDVLHVSYFDRETDDAEVSWLPDSVAGTVGTRAEDALARACALVAPEVRCETHYRAGAPASTILAFAKACRADLIVMGSRRMDALHAALLGSVSTDVLKGAACPVTVVKAAVEP